MLNIVFVFFVISKKLIFFSFTLNLIYQNITFTAETVVDSKLPFLDTFVIFSRYSFPTYLYCGKHLQVFTLILLVLPLMSILSDLLSYFPNS